MSDDLIERVESVLVDVTPEPWVVNTEGWATISHESDSVLHGYYEGDCQNCEDRITDGASVALGYEDLCFIVAARSLVPELAAEVKRLRAMEGRVRMLAESWRYKGEFGWGAWQEGHGPDIEGRVLDGAASALLKAVAGD